MIRRAFASTSIAEAAFLLAAGHLMLWAGASDRVGLLVGLPGLLLVLFGWPALAAALVRWDSRPLFWSGWYVELAAVGAVVTGLLVAESVVRPTLAVALGNARALADVQAMAGAGPVESVLRWPAAVPLVAVALNVIYVFGHFLVTPAVAVSTFWRAGDVWRVHRWVLPGTWVVALLLFWLCPVAPPWLLDRSVDTMPAAHQLGSGVGIDMLAAFPSLHVVWACWAGWTMRVRGGSAWWWSYPVLVSVVVVATGNHYVADVIGGWGLFGAAWWVVRRVTRVSRLGAVPHLAIAAEAA